MPTTAPARPVSTAPTSILAYALPVLVLVQAAIAGQHLFEGASISIHGMLGEGTFALTVAGVVLAWVRKCDTVVFFTAVALMALSFAQVGLGFVGRDTTAAAGVAHPDRRGDLRPHHLPARAGDPAGLARGATGGRPDR